MGFLEKLKNIFRKKEVEEKSETPPPELKEEISREPLTPPPEREAFTPPPPTIPTPTPQPEVGLRDKLEVIAAQIDSLKAQNQMIIERLKNLEKMIAEMRGIRYY